MESRLQILHLEDDSNDVKLVKQLLDDAEINCKVEVVHTREAFISALNETHVDIILADYSLPSFDGISALRIARDKHSEIPFLFVSGAIGEERAIEALKTGATDYVLKQRMSRLIPCLQRALQETQERRTRIQAQEALKEAHDKLELKVEERTAELAEMGKELARSNEELKQFASIASHDIRAPLRTISQLGELLERDYASLLDERGRELLIYMTAAARRLTTLTKSLLDYAGVGKAQLNVQEIDLEKVVQNVKSDLDVVIKEKNARLESGSLRSIQGDPVLIQQLFQNLVANSLKFSDPDKSPVITINGELKRDAYFLTFKDNGIGFDQRNAENIFVPFKRLHPESEYEGSGIGLANCQKIVDKHHGSITAHSQPGEGAAFVVALPITLSIDSIAEQID